MTKSMQAKAAGTANAGSAAKSRMGHWGRVAVMCLSGGFIFPNAMTEEDDMVREDSGKKSKTKG